MSDRPGPESGSDARAVAVALGYDPASGRAPVVLAKGHGTIAEQILSLAFAHGVRVREDADLAELLAAVDIDTEIPVEAMLAVAEILTYLYQANARLGETPGTATAARSPSDDGPWTDPRNDARAENQDGDHRQRP